MIDFPPDEPPAPKPDPSEYRRPVNAEAAPTAHAGSNPILILVAWAVVAVPLAWGITQTVKTSMALFQGSAQVHVANSDFRSGPTGPGVKN